MKCKGPNARIYYQPNSEHEVKISIKFLAPERVPEIIGPDNGM